MKKDLVSIRDLTPSQIDSLLEMAGTLKGLMRYGKSITPLKDKTFCLIFEKPSLRTRVTFEVGIHELGGNSIYLAPQDIQIGKRETVEDVARNLERWVHGVVARTFSHQSVVDLAKYASIPVINALTDFLHPCQVLSDLFTLSELSQGLRGIKVAYVGDGNNVAHSWIYGAAKTGVDLWLACPDGYYPSEEVVREGQGFASETGATIQVTGDPREAADMADVIYTDVWASMGQEEERAQRLERFKPYQVNGELMALAKTDAHFMHCLPAHRGEEVSAEVIDGAGSLVFDQAENRLHMQKAVLEWIFSS